MATKSDYIQLFLKKKTNKKTKSPWRRCYDPEAVARDKKQKQELYQDY